MNALRPPGAFDTPATPKAISWFRTVGLRLCLAAWFFLLVVNGIWSLADGTLLRDNDSSTYNFLEDVPNLINYALVCPAYLVLGAFFLSRVGNLRRDLAATGLATGLGIETNVWDHPPNKPILIPTWLLISFVTTAYYFAELPSYPWRFWFQEAGRSGDPILGAHGYYYFVTNLALNLLAVAIVLAHLEMFTVSAIISNALKGISSNERPLPEVLSTKESLRAALLPYSNLYITSKALVVVFLVNMYTWRAQQPGFMGMLELTIIIIAVLGMLVVSYPRYHIQYWIYRLWGAKKTDEYLDIRTPIAVGIASTADFLILGSAMFSLLNYVLLKGGFQIRF